MVITHTPQRNPLASMITLHVVPCGQGEGMATLILGFVGPRNAKELRQAEIILKESSNGA